MLQSFSDNSEVWTVGWRKEALRNYAFFLQYLETADNRLDNGENKAQANPQGKIIISCSLTHISSKPVSPQTPTKVKPASNLLHEIIII